MFRGGLPDEFDHLLVAVPTLDEGIAMLERALGVRAAVGGKHAAWGTHNALLGLGPRRYVELIALDPAAAPEARARGASTFGFSSATMPRVLGWCAAARDLDARVDAAARAGVELGAPVEGGRERSDGTRLRWRSTPPLLLAEGLVPFFIDWGDSPHPSLDAPSGCRLARLEGEHPDPERVWRMLAAVDAKLSVSRGPRARLIATFEGPAGSLTLSEGRGVSRPRQTPAS